MQTNGSVLIWCFLWQALASLYGGRPVWIHSSTSVAEAVILVYFAALLVGLGEWQAIAARVGGGLSKL